MMFGRAPAAMSLWTMGLNQRRWGTWANNLVYNLHLLTGKICKPGSTALFLLQRVRDEAHRFAITYHKKLRERKFLHSPLEDVPGLGPKRITTLKKHFGNLKAIESASAEQLAEADGISPNLAAIIYNHLHLG